VKVFGDDEKLTTALLDRLAHHATVIPTKGKSFRMRKRPGAPPDEVSALPREAEQR
jgi:DNA replication protein DnaC